MNVYTKINGILAKWVCDTKCHLEAINTVKEIVKNKPILVVIK